MLPDLLPDAVNRLDLLEQLERLSQATFGFVDGHVPHRVSFPWTAACLMGLAPGRRVLDLGTGITPLPIFLAERGMSVMCVDRAPMQTSLPIADGASPWRFFDYGLLHHNLSARSCPVEELTPATSFDAVYSVGFLSHLSARSRRELFARCHGWLSPGGVMTHAVDLIPSSDFLWNRLDDVEIEPPMAHGSVQDVLIELAERGYAVRQSTMVRAIPESRTDLWLVESCRA